MGRDSYVRVKSGAPVSADLERLADDVREFGDEVAAGRMSAGQVSARLEMLARRIDGLTGMSRAVEEMALREVV